MGTKAIVIGGGIAGLSAGIYAQKCGFDVTVLEGHNIPGGNCTSWRRGGYLFEGGMHWLTGSCMNEAINKSWRYVGALNGDVAVHYREPFLEYNHEGIPVRFYRDVDKTELEWLELSPADAAEIKKLCGNIRKVKNFSMPLSYIRGVKVTKKVRPSPSLLLAALSALLVMSRFSKISVEQYINRFKHEGIREILRSCSSESMGIAPLFFTMGTLARGDGGFPEGGSLPFAKRMADTLTSLGGKIFYGARAERVIMENSKAVGVAANMKGADSGIRRFDADAVIVAADTMAIDYLFDEPIKSDWLDEMKAKTRPTMATFVSLGIGADLRRYPGQSIYKPDSPLRLGGQTYKYLSVNNYASDPVYSPEGKSALTLILDGDTYDFWKKARADNTYADEKEKLAGGVITALARFMPEIYDNVEVWDVATPLTYERYCGNWKGSWMTEMDSWLKVKTYPPVIKGLDGVYFAGHRMMPPGGLPIALTSGRTAVQYLCRDTGTLFVGED